jgi:hypothetical protein
MSSSSSSSANASGDCRRWSAEELDRVGVLLLPREERRELEVRRTHSSAREHEYSHNASARSSAAV